MPSSRRSLAVRSFLLLLACCTCLNTARAQDPGTAALDPSGGSVGLKLRLQPSLLPTPTGTTTQDQLPIFVEADRLQGTAGKWLDADGNVIVRRRGQTLYADRLSYSAPENAITATGHVRVDRLGDEVTGDRAGFDLDDDSGYIDNPTYRLRQLHARGQANRIILKDKDHIRAERATYTNCAVGDDDWFLRVRRLELDRITDVGVAHNATVYFKGVPILYTPRIDFPLSERRKSGFLAPTFGSTNKSGVEFTLPYYWNIAPNADYTLRPQAMSKRGVLWDNEFRYLEPTFSGNLRAAGLADDRITGESRWGYLLKHNQRFSSRLSGWVDLEGVSDSQYFIDMSDQIAATSQANLPRAAALNYNGDWWKASLSSVRYQTLQTDPLAPVVPPYARVPQLLLDASRPNTGGFDLGFFGEADNFQHPTLVSGWRQVYYPKVSLPLHESLFYVIPTVGFNYTRYTFPATTLEPQNRSLPITTVDSGMTFQRDTTIGSRNFVQTLEPRLYYVYIPFRQQDQLPVYDTAQADFDITQIFYWNQFSGWDRINDADQVTAGATSRLIEPLTGVEILRATLAQRYYFKEQLVQLNNVVPSTSRSDLLAGLTGQLSRSWSLNAGVQWGIDGGELQKFNVGARYQPQTNQILNFGYRFTRDQIQQIDVSGQWPLTRRWSAMARWDYSILNKSLLEGLVGLEYNAGCWAGRMVVHRFVTGTSQWSNAIFFQLELTGLSRLGSNPFEVLKQSIGGYTKPPVRPAGAPQEYYPGMDTQ